MKAASSLFMAANAMGTILAAKSQPSGGGSGSGSTSPVGQVFGWLLGKLRGGMKRLLSYLMGLISTLVTPKSWDIGGKLKMNFWFVGGEADFKITFGQ